MDDSLQLPPTAHLEEEEEEGMRTPRDQEQPSQDVDVSNSSRLFLGEEEQSNTAASPPHTPPKDTYKDLMQSEEESNTAAPPQTPPKDTYKDLMQSEEEEVGNTQDKADEANPQPLTSSCSNTEDAAQLLLGMMDASNSSSIKMTQEDNKDLSVLSESSAENALSPLRKAPPRKASSPQKLMRESEERLYAFIWDELKALGWKAKRNEKRKSLSQGAWSHIPPQLTDEGEVNHGKAIHSQAELLRHVKEEMPELYQRGMNKIKPLSATAAAAAAAAAASVSKAALGNFANLWRRLQVRGWCEQEIDGKMCFVCPQSASPDHQQQLIPGQDYFDTPEAVREYLVETSVLGEEELELVHAPSDFTFILERCLPNFERDLWAHLSREMNWTYTHGRNGIEYFYFVPGGKSPRDGGKRNVDYFESRTAVYEYVGRNASRFLVGLAYRKMDMATMRFTTDVNDPELACEEEEQEPVQEEEEVMPKPKRRPQPRSSQPQQQVSFPQRQRVSSSRTDLDIYSILPNFELDLWIHLEREMGWTYLRGGGLVPYIYFPPGGKQAKEGGVRNVDYFESSDRVYTFVSQNTKHLAGLVHPKNGLDLSTCTFVKPNGSPLRRRRPSGAAGSTLSCRIRSVSTDSSASSLYVPSANTRPKKKPKKSTSPRPRAASSLPSKKRAAFRSAWEYCWHTLAKRGWVREVREEDGMDIYFAPGAVADRSVFHTRQGLMSWVKHNDAALHRESLEYGEEEELDEEAAGGAKRNRHFAEVSETSTSSTTGYALFLEEEQRRREREAKSNADAEKRVRQFTGSLVGAAAAAPTPAAAPVTPTPQQETSVKQQQQDDHHPVKPVAAIASAPAVYTRGSLFSGRVFLFSGISTPEASKTMQRKILAQQGRIINDIWKYYEEQQDCSKLILLAHPTSFRTAAYLSAYVLGVPILHPSFIDACLTGGGNQYLSDYTAFAVPTSFLLSPTLPSGGGGVLPVDDRLEYTPSSTWSRNSSGNAIGTIFHGRSFQVVDNAAPLQRLVRAMGGRVVDYNAPPEDADVIFLTPIESNSRETTLRVMQGRAVYTFDWVTQCLLQAKFLAPPLPPSQAHPWFSAQQPPSETIASVLSTAVVAATENDEQQRIRPLVVTTPSPTSICLDVFQVGSKRYYVGDFVLIGEEGGAEEEDNATFGRIRKVEYDARALKYRTQVDVFHRTPRSDALLQWRKSRPTMEFDATSIIAKFACVPAPGLEAQARSLTQEHFGCCGADHASWKDRVYVLYY